MTGLTLDTGALVALERRRARALTLLRAAHQRRLAVSVPVVVVTEWWRGRTDRREAILGALLVESMDPTLARIAGEALGAVPGSTAIDAVVMASAARRGDAVLTSDMDDLTRLASHFPGVRILRV